ncbi:xylulose kinase-1 [Tanacetum coccineum]
MVAFLNKSEGSKGFQQIVDFLNTSHIKFALTENPTIYTSLIQQFWKTASTSTFEDGEVEIIATTDGQLKTITEASLRRHLKLEDADGISSLPNTEIFEQLALMGYAFASNKLTFQKGQFSPQWRFLIHTILHCLSPKKTGWEQFSSNIATAIICLAINRTFNFSKMIFEGMQGEGSTVPVESHHIPITTPSTLRPPLSSPSRVPTLPHDLPLPRGYTPGSDEGRMQHTELIDLVIKLSDKVLALETDLQQTKKVYSTTVTKLIMKVKRLEKIVKSSKARRRAHIIVFDDEKVSKDSSKQGRMIDDIDQDVRTNVSRVHTYSRRRRTVSTGSGEVSTASRIISTTEETVSTAGASMPVSTTGLVQEITSSSRASKDKGKALYQEESHRIARDAEIALRLQEEIDAARVEADEERTHKLQAEEREKYSEVDQAKMLVDLINQRKRFFAQQRAKAKRNKPITQAKQRTYMSNYIKNQEGVHRLKRAGQEVLEEPAKRQKIGKASGSGEEQYAEKEKEDLVKKWFRSSEPTVDKEKVSWVKLKRLFDPAADDTLWKLQRYMHDPLKLRLYDTCGVHHVSTERGHDIFMLVEKDYPLTRVPMTIMLANKL